MASKNSVQHMTAPLNPAKFRNPELTAKGEPRASVSFRGLETLWVNTGTLCNITCKNCYIESSPENDRLIYVRADELRIALDEAEARREPLHTVGFTGGEPFLNPQMTEMMRLCLERKLNVLVLTNAMKPMMRPPVQAALVALQRYREQLTFRVSLDHWRKNLHDEERGLGSFTSALDGMKWLATQGFHLSVAGRLRWGDNDTEMRDGFSALFRQHDISIDANNKVSLVLFPEMDASTDVPEITTACWDILKQKPDDLMCATSRMLVRRKGAATASYTSCTLLPYDLQFDLGTTLGEASTTVKLNHPHCAKFCVLGGASCS